MGMTAKITSKGQTTVPAEARAILGVKPGDRVRYVPQGDGSLRIEKVDDSLMTLRGLLDLGRPVANEEIVEAVHDTRRLVGRGLARD